MPPNDDSAWMAEAACRPIGGNDWFPAGNDADAKAAAKNAKLICNEICTVRKRCLDWALARGEMWGIWGGVNLEAASTRRRLRRQLSITPVAPADQDDGFPHGTESGYRQHIATLTPPCHACIAAAVTARDNRNRGA